MGKRIGMITIGQSPRDDVTPDFLKIIGEDVEIIQKGALDGLRLDEIEKMKPVDGAYTLVTRLKDGKQVMISKDSIIPRMQKMISELDEEEINPILLLCTGDFPSFQANSILLEPQKILHYGVKGIVGTGRLGVLTPAIEQVEQAKIKWKTSGIEAVAAFGSPYAEGDDFLKGIKDLSEEDIQFIVMDCMGYTIRMKEKAAEITEKPIILARTLVARIMAEVIR